MAAAAACARLFHGEHFLCGCRDVPPASTFFSGGEKLKETRGKDPREKEIENEKVKTTKLTLTARASAALEQRAARVLLLLLLLLLLLVLLVAELRRGESFFVLLLVGGRLLLDAGGVGLFLVGGREFRVLGGPLLGLLG